MNLKLISRGMNHAIIWYFELFRPIWATARFCHYVFRSLKLNWNSFLHHFAGNRFFYRTEPFLFILVMTLLGSISGCLLYYIVARKFGRSMYNYFYQKFPLAKRGLDKASELSERYGAMMCFTGRIIPTVRVFISLMSGVFQIPFKTYLIYSAAGITVWNFITLFIGYLTAIYS